MTDEDKEKLVIVFLASMFCPPVGFGLAIYWWLKDRQKGDKNTKHH